MKRQINFNAFLKQLVTLLCERSTAEFRLNRHRVPPSFITIDSAEGNTGAVPMVLVDDMGLLLRAWLA